MLNLDALESAMPLATMLDDRRMFLLPIPGSPLELLTRATRCDTKLNYLDEKNQPQPDLQNIAFFANARDNALGYSEHDMVMDDLTGVGVKAVRAHVSVARTLVAPAVAELAEYVATSLNAAKSVSVLLGMQVEQWNPSELLVNKAFETEVRKFDGTPFTDPAMPFDLPSLSFEELMKVMETGKASVDSDIAVWAATKGQNYFLNLWSAMFQRGGDVRVSFSAMINDRQEGADVALAVYLLARRLLEDVPENTNMSLSQYTNYMTDFRDQAALRICSAMDELNRDLKQGRLVRSADDRTTVVNALIYKEWIENGGCNEVLFGNMLKQPCVFTTAALDEQKDALLEMWHKHERYTLLTESTKRYNRLIEALRAGFQKQMMNLAEGEETHIDNLTTVNKLFEEQLQTVGINDTDNLYKLCLRLICRSRFYKTAAEKILGAVDRISRENPGIDVREAAAMSTAEYVAEWVVSQIKPHSM